jgi:hypothetical protein
MEKYTRPVGTALVTIGIGVVVLAIPHLLLPLMRLAADFDIIGLSLTVIIEGLKGVGIFVVGVGVLRMGQSLQHG